MPNQYSTCIHLQMNIYIFIHIVCCVIMLTHVKLTEGYGQISLGTISEEFAKKVSQGYQDKYHVLNFSFLDIILSGNKEKKSKIKITTNSILVV